jgi:carboxyl-terminal processing protease
MPRRNIVLTVGVVLFSLLCFARADRNPHGRYFAEILNQVDRHALETLPRQQLYEAGVRGMLSALDEHTGYSNQAESQQLNELLDQEFAGIGIRVDMQAADGHLTILSPIHGSPAFKAGLRAGDRIDAIDGESTKGLSMDDAVRKLRGPVGQAVKLLIVHAGEATPVELSVVRSRIQVESVVGDYRRPDGDWSFQLAADPQIGYVRINTFGARTVEELRAALEQIEKAGCKALVLDLRDNAGGLLTAGIETADLFLESGTIMTTRGREGEVLDAYEAHPGSMLTGLPVAVLINRYSASASEIVAAALQDHERAVVVGERSWGKGTVQNVLKVEGGRALLRLTTAGYWRPSGRNIHRRRDADPNDIWGVEPNPGLNVSLDEEQRRKLSEHWERRDVVGGPQAAQPAESLADDPQLAKAVEALLGKLPVGK